MNQYLDEIDNDIAAKHLLKHPFYLAWTRGELSKEALKDYAGRPISLSAYRGRIPSFGKTLQMASASMMPSLRELRNNQKRRN